MTNQLPDIFEELSDKEEVEKYLRTLGWHTWYSDNYWVNPEVIQDSSIQDYTMYGMSAEQALQWEAFGRVKIKPLNQRLYELISKGDK